MRALIRQAGDELIRRRFTSTPELLAGVYAALVQFLESRELIRHGPFDAAPCFSATLNDLDPERMSRFIRQARHERGFPLNEDAAPEELLTHLNLLTGGRPTHAAVLLFGKQPQRFLISSEITRVFSRYSRGKAHPVLPGL
jgi:predicted HTH transcriptional regulator